MTQREDIIVTKINRTESFSVFLSYSGCISYVYDMGLRADEKPSQEIRYRKYQEVTERRSEPTRILSMYKSQRQEL